MRRQALALLVLGVALAVTPLSPAAPTQGDTFLVAEPALYIDSIDGALASTAGDLPFLNLACASLMRLPDKPLPAGFRVAPELAAAFPKEGYPVNAPWCVHGYERPPMIVVSGTCSS